MKMKMEYQCPNYSWATGATQRFVRMVTQPAATPISFVRIQGPAFMDAYWLLSGCWAASGVHVTKFVRMLGHEENIQGS